MKLYAGALKFLTLTFILLILPAETGYASFNVLQDSLQTAETSVRVDSIIIYGNKITESDVILQELTFKPGDNVTQKVLAYNRERVFSLGLFTNVNIFPIFRDTLTFIVINVKESWYIWPVPFVDIKDNTIKRTTYGLDLQFKNFRGKNESLRFVAGFGYDPSFGFSYYRPWLVRKENIFLSADLFYKHPVNKSVAAQSLYGESFYYTIYTGSLMIGRRFDPFNTAGVWAGYDYVESPRFVPAISASESRIDRVFRAGISYTFDSRDLKQFPDSGFYAALSFEQKGFGMNHINYSAAKLDFRSYYRLIGDLSAKWRFASRLTFGPGVPYYDYSLIGSGEKIRGHFNEIIEGHHFYLASVELKYPIIKEWNFSIKVPLIPRQLTSYRIAIFSNVFGDAGAVQQRNAKLSLRDFNSGYGAGLIFLLLPYNIVRLEYALNELRKGELLFGFGFSF